MFFFLLSALAFSPFFDDCLVIKRLNNGLINTIPIKPLDNHHQQIEIVLDDYKKNESSKAQKQKPSFKMTEIIITPSSVIQNQSDDHSYNNTNHRINEFYLASPKYKSSSSSSNVSMQFDRLSPRENSNELVTSASNNSNICNNNNNNNAANKLAKSIIYSTESIESSSSLSSNLINSSPSPSEYQKLNKFYAKNLSGTNNNNESSFNDVGADVSLNQHNNYFALPTIQVSVNLPTHHQLRISSDDVPIRQSHKSPLRTNSMYFIFTKILKVSQTQCSSL